MLSILKDKAERFTPICGVNLNNYKKGKKKSIDNISPLIGMGQGSLIYEREI